MAIFHTGKNPSIPGTKQTERKKEAVALARLLAGFCNRVVTQSGPGERLVATLKPTHLRVQWQSALPPVYFVFSSHVPTIIIIIREESRFARGDRVIFSFSFSLSFSLCVCVCVCVPLFNRAVNQNENARRVWFITSCWIHGTSRVSLFLLFLSRFFRASSNAKR